VGIVYCVILLIPNSLLQNYSRIIFASSGVWLYNVLSLPCHGIILETEKKRTIINIPFVKDLDHWVSVRLSLKSHQSAKDEILIIVFLTLIKTQERFMHVIILIHISFQCNMFYTSLNLVEVCL